jgi:acyl-coenzyme A thioesterase 13
MSDLFEFGKGVLADQPFSRLLGAELTRLDPGQAEIVLCVRDDFRQQHGFVHGGVFSSLADIALGYNAAFATEPPVPMVTVSQTIDYAGSARKGDWIEIETDVQKVGRSMAFANCYFFVGGKRIARASAVFNVLTRNE